MPLQEISRAAWEATGRSQSPAIDKIKWRSRRPAVLREGAKNGVVDHEPYKTARMKGKRERTARVCAPGEVSRHVLFHDES